jgi:hypothetical protein
VAMAAVVRIINLFTLLAVIPLIAGTVLITRPAASSADQESQ